MYNVLIADDEPVICDYIEQVLASIPAIHNIYKFYDGQEAYSFLEENTVDICLLDVSMPGKTGLDMAELLCSQNNGTQVLLISAHRDFSFAQKAIRFGVKDYLTKPFSSQKLQQLMLDCINGCKSLSASRKNRWIVLRDYMQLLISGGYISADLSQVMLCDGTVSLSQVNCTEVRLHIPKLPFLSPATQQALDGQLCGVTEENTPRQTGLCLHLRNAPDTFLLLYLSPGQPEPRGLRELPQLLTACNVGEYTVKSSAPLPFSDYLKRITFEKKMDAFWQKVSGAGILEAQKTIDGYLQTVSVQTLGDFARYLEQTYSVCVDRPEREEILAALNSVVKQSRHGDSKHHLITTTMEYIDRNYQAAWLSLEAVADSLNISPEHLSRTFKKITGQKFSDYLVKYRIQKAIALLTDNSLSIKQISENVGFSNTAYFRSCFKTHCGITPTQYRKLRARGE